MNEKKTRTERKLEIAFPGQTLSFVSGIMEREHTDLYS